uniref:hypothetical protein n=1 Tax=uncultured Nostoc sp. TaxID=340711 RepID=UPI0035CC3847
MEPYERLLGDAMRGDPTLFVREDTVEEEWRIVQPILDNVISHPFIENLGLKPRASSTALIN